MKKQETNLHMVSDSSMMDWLADEEFNNMTGSGSGSGSGCGYGCGYGSGSDNWVLDPCYVQAGTLSTTSRGTAEVEHTVFVSWEAGIIPTKIYVTIQAEWHVGNRSFPCSVKNITARWVGYYGITVTGEIACEGGHTETIIEGFTIPMNLRGEKKDF